MKTLMLLLILSAPPVITRTWTNRAEQTWSVISTKPVPGNCPECGMPNHHNEEVRIMSGWDRVYTEIVFDGKTSQVQIAATPLTNWIATNIVFRHTRQPGAVLTTHDVPPMPLPVSTNK